MMAKNWRLASSENPSTSLVTWRMISRQRGERLVGQRIPHLRARALFHLRQRVQHLQALARIRNVVRDGGPQQGAQILRAIGQRRIRTNHDALHALRAIFGNVERGFAARDVLGRGVAAAGGHDSHRHKRRGWLVVPVVGAELGIERRDSRQRCALGLTAGKRMRAAP